MPVPEATPVPVAVPVPELDPEPEPVPVPVGLTEPVGVPLPVAVADGPPLELGLVPGLTPSLRGHNISHILVHSAEAKCNGTK